MPWLVRDGEVLATLEVAASGRTGSKGLLGRDGIEGAILLQPVRPTALVHTVGMRFPIDVAYLDGELRVVGTASMRPWRLGCPRPKMRAVLEAEAGAFARWRLVAGDQLEIKG
jgi:uncharacterized membrane protein (UPF0127 family)